MLSFRCRCGNRLYFDNTRCLACGATLGFLPESLRLAALAPAGDAWCTEDGEYRQCLHYRRDGVCNWMVPAADPEPFCAACRLNEMIPDLGVPGNRLYWARLEAAKRYLMFGLKRLGLPFSGRGEDDPQGLGFAFLADWDEDHRVLTGHVAGLITINVREADDVYREDMRQRMQESYRTLLGHFRHESGHYFWHRLVQDTPWQAEFRQLFGDERQDYAQALGRHYQAGGGDWRDGYISAYAASHPWEDWAETWGHYLLLRDTLETAEDAALLPPLGGCDLNALLEAWGRLSVTVNRLGHSLGISSLYPFVLSPRVCEKLGLVHQVVSAQTRP